MKHQNSIESDHLDSPKNKLSSLCMIASYKTDKNKKRYER